MHGACLSPLGFDFVTEILDDGSSCVGLLLCDRVRGGRIDTPTCFIDLPQLAEPLDFGVFIQIRGKPLL